MGTRLGPLPTEIDTVALGRAQEAPQVVVPLPPLAPDVLSKCKQPWKAMLTVLSADRPGKEHKGLCRSGRRGTRFGSPRRGVGTPAKRGRSATRPAPHVPRTGARPRAQSSLTQTPTPPAQSGSAQAQSGISAGHRGWESGSGCGRGRDALRPRPPRFLCLGSAPLPGRVAQTFPACISHFR